MLLDLMIHSLYTNKEIFLRELISNASDAIDRLRYESLVKPELLDSDENFHIRLETDHEAMTITISDNGMGMNRQEVISNIGTIAKSGTRELRQKLEQGQSSQILEELVGQFGVGFYSAFMVADKVTLLTRKAGEEEATEWESSGDGLYTISEAQKAERGTSIKLHLKSPDPENGIEDFTDERTISRIVKRYSDFVAYPIIHKVERNQSEQNNDSAATVEDKILNSMKPVWAKSPSETTQEEMAECYRHISHDWTEPLQTMFLKAEGRVEYKALLFVPSKAPYDLFYHSAEGGLRLYAKRIMIMEQCPDLLPGYLRFIKGVVDSADLPLNISRQMLQQDRHIALIRKWLTKKVINNLEHLRDTENDKYLKFWSQFGRALKEGVSSDYENKDAIVALLLFQSSRDGQELTTLKQYVERMKEGQNEIFYMTGESNSVIDNSPHLEAFKEKGYEVLYLTDPVDEILVQALTEFEGRKLKSAAKGRVELGDEQEKERIEKELQEKEKDYSGLINLLQTKLDANIKQVRLTNRLTVSPVCLVGTEMDYSPQLERLLQRGKGGGPKQRRIMEMNPNHPIIIKMRKRFEDNAEDPALNDYAELLLGYALLAEGSELSDPVEFNRRVAKLMEQTL